MNNAKCGNKTVCCICKDTIPEGVTLVNIIEKPTGNLYACKDCNMIEEITVYQVRTEDCKGYVEQEKSKIISMLDCLEVGEAVFIEKRKMPLVKYLALPEFEGF